MSRNPEPTLDPSATIPARGTVTETIALEPVPLDRVGAEMARFLGPRPYSQVHPRLGTIDPARVVSADRLRAIRYGGHERDSATGSSGRRHHYHEETWSLDAAVGAMHVADNVRRVPVPVSSCPRGTAPDDDGQRAPIAASFDALTS
jgi:hypothetical protein